MSEYVDAISEGTEEIREVAYHLQDMARAYHTLGQNELGEKMWELSSRLIAGETIIQGAVSREINDRLKTSQEASTNMVMGMLAASKLAKEEQ